MSFVITGLDPSRFQPLFALTAEALLAIGARRLVADRPDAYPCRVGLRRAEPGEDLLLLNHEHQPAPASPYRSSGPIFVGRNSPVAGRVVGDLAPSLRHRTLSLRAYDDAALIVDAALGEEDGARSAIARFLADDRVAYVHAHFAGRGCYAARIDRS